MTKELLGELELNRVYQMDCLEGMKLLPDKSIDLVCIDPPYNIGVAKWDKWNTVESYVNFMGEVISESERLLKDHGSFYFFHNDYLQMVEIQNWINSNSKLLFKRLIVWDKYNGSKWNQLNAIVHSDSNRNYPKQAEYCLFYTFQSEEKYETTFKKQVMRNVNNFVELRNYFKTIHNNTKKTKSELMKILGYGVDHCLRYGSPQWEMPSEKIYNQLCELVVLEDFEYFSYNKLREMYKEEYNKLWEVYQSQRYIFNNNDLPSVWVHEPISQNGHITPKPVSLIENIIKTSTNEGDVVLDCFMGSGTTAIAATKNKRNFVGFEKESKYIEIANKRLDDLEVN